MTEEELRNRMYEIKLEIARIEYDHHTNSSDLEDKVKKLKEEYNKVKKELMRQKLESRGRGK